LPGTSSIVIESRAGALQSATANVRSPPSMSAGAVATNSVAMRMV
jgi:hypothetical protein